MTRYSIDGTPSHRRTIIIVWYSYIFSYHLVEYNLELCINTNYTFYIIKVNPIHFDNIDSVIIILTIENHIIILTT